MNARTSDVKKTRTPRVPYTPPATRRSAGDTAAISNKKVEAHGGAGAAAEKGSAWWRDSGSVGGQQQQDRAGKQTPCQQIASEDDNEEIRRSPAVVNGEITRVNTGRSDKRTGEGGCSRGESDSRETGRASTCRPPSPTPPGLKHTSPPKVAGGATGNRRQPRQAWSQYVPPGRRGAGSNESVRSPVPETKPSTPTVVDSRGIVGSSGGASSRPPLNQKATKHRSSTVVADDQPAAATAADEQTASAETTATPSSPSTSDACDVEGNETVSSTTREERRTSCAAHSPVPSPIPAARSNRLAARETTGNTPPPMAACEEREARADPSRAAPAVGTDALETPCKEPTNGTAKSEPSRDVDDHDQDQLPPFKPPSARYIPPGRRKALDAEAAAAAANGDDAAGDWMGPLWTSRAPVRVSQREREPTNASPASRPSPARVAGVVSGGMSAYGANISEYSGESRGLLWPVGVCSLRIAVGVPGKTN